MHKKGQGGKKKYYNNKLLMQMYNCKSDIQGLYYWCYKFELMILTNLSFSQKINYINKMLRIA